MAGTVEAYSPYMAGKPASSAYATPCGTSMAVMIKADNRSLDRSLRS